MPVVAIGTSKGTHLNGSAFRLSWPEPFHLMLRTLYLIVFPFLFQYFLLMQCIIYSSTMHVATLWICVHSGSPNSS